MIFLSFQIIAFDELKTDYKNPIDQFTSSSKRDEADVSNVRSTETLSETGNNIKNDYFCGLCSLQFNKISILEKIKVIAYRPLEEDN